MTTLKVTSRGQITLHKDVLRHLGIKAGGDVSVDLLPDGSARLQANVRSGTIADLHGILKDKTNGRRLTIEEINEAIEEAGAAAGLGSQ